VTRIHRFKDWSLIAALFMLGVVGCAGLLADVLVEPAAEIDIAAERLLPPGEDHVLGTDALGRDMLTRLVQGARTSLLAGFASVVAAVLLGTIVGLAAGLGPRWLDRLLMGLTDLFLAFPRVILALLLVSLVEPSLTVVIVVIALTGWMVVARLVRAEVLTLREREFILAVRGLGIRPVTVAVRHLLPHVMPLIIVAVALRLGNAILMEAFLSFLGLSAQEPVVSWGAMIEHGRTHLLDSWWLTAWPGIAISWTVVSVNLLGDALKDRHHRQGKGGETDDSWSVAEH